MEKCDVLFAYEPKLSAEHAWELFYAKMRGEKTYAYAKSKTQAYGTPFRHNLKKMKELEKVLKAINVQQYGFKGVKPSRQP